MGLLSHAVFKATEESVSHHHPSRVTGSGSTSSPCMSTSKHSDPSMSSSHPKAKGAYSFLSSVKRSIATCWPYKSISSNQPLSPRLDPSQRNATLNHDSHVAQNLAHEGSDDLASGVGSNTPKPPLEITSRWVWSVSSYQFSTKPDQEFCSRSYQLKI